MDKKRKNFRLPNGAGSVYKLSGNRRNPWTAVMHLGYTEYGKPIRKYIGYYPSYEEALHGLEMFKETPYDLNNKDITISELFKIFMERKKNVSHNTVLAYQSHFKNFEPISNKPIRLLKTHELQKVFDNAPQGYDSKITMKSILNQLFNIAMELDVISKNYCQFVTIEGKKDSTMHQPFTVLELRKLWEISKHNQFAEIPLILCYTGMRPQELLLIKKEDINLEGRYMKGGIKTKAGKDRIIPIHEAIYPFIERRFNIAKAYLIENNCKQYNYMTFSRHWKKFMEDSGLHHLPHDGRHTFITIAQNKRMDLVILKRIVGHASTDITEKVYTHKDIKQLVQAVNNL